MAHPKHTIDDIKRKLESVGKGIVLTGEYLTKRTKTTFKHIECGYEWLTTFDVVGRLGSGCPICSLNSRKISLDEVDRRLKQKNILLIDEYVGANYKTKFKHVDCDHEWFAKPADLIYGLHGCPKCAKHGFNTSKPAWTYIIETNNYIKYGITNNLNQRLKAHKRNGDVVIHHTHHFNSGQDAKLWENNIKDIFGGSYASKEQCPDGYTETLPLSKLNDLLIHVNEQVNIFG